MPLGGGAHHSMCSRQSPNFSFVMRVPLFATTSMYPFSIFQPAGTILPLSGPLVTVVCHFERSVPSNRMTAPAGAGAGLSAAGSGGATMGGCGRFRSCTRHSCPGMSGVLE